MSFKVGIITTSVRENSVGKDVANWVFDYASQRKDQNTTYEIVLLSDYNLKLFGTNANVEEQEVIAKWKEKINSFDAYIFVVAEYNHSFTGAFKNASDYLKSELHNKVAGFVGYGGLGATRAILQMRMVLAEQQVATVQKTTNFLLATDFANFKMFQPSTAGFHEANTKLMIDQLLSWGKALRNNR